METPGSNDLQPDRQAGPSTGVLLSAVSTVTQAGGAYRFRSTKKINYADMDSTTPASGTRRRKLSIGRTPVKADDPDKIVRTQAATHLRRLESPRTDYTYAKSQSYHEKTPSPMKVQVPNLSRESSFSKRSPTATVQFEFKISRFSRLVASTKKALTSVVTFPVHLVVRIFIFVTSILISSVLFPARYFRNRSQKFGFSEASNAVRSNGVNPLDYQAQSRQVAVAQCFVQNGGNGVTTDENHGGVSSFDETTQDVVVERHKQTIREVVIEKHWLPSASRGSLCGFPCWCLLPLLILVPLIGFILSREEILQRPVPLVVPSEAGVNVQWMKDVTTRLIDAETKLKTPCKPDPQEIQQLRDLVTAYQMKIKDDVALQLETNKAVLLEAASTESASASKAAIGAVRTAVQDDLARQLRQMLSSSQEEWKATIQGSLDSTSAKLGEYERLRDRLDSLEKMTLSCDDCADVFKKVSAVSRSESGQYSVGDIDKMIAAAIWKYDNDKTGMPDYALEPAGGTVLSTRCSETYNAYTRKESIFGFPLWYLSYSPRTVIQPGVVPGECWAFKGSSGFLVVKLSGIIQVTSVSYEHISKSVSPDGHIDSAPRVFRLFGLMTENDANGVFMGEYTFDQDAPSLQNFQIKVAGIAPVPIIEFRIMSNHGHPVYTCLYRLRVHGKRVHPAYGG